MKCFKCSVKLQVAFVAALPAGIRLDIPRAEATLRAEQAHSFTLVFLCILEHAFVEVLSLQYVVAGVAAPRCSALLAGDAILVGAFERPGIFLLSARCAGMASHAAEGPIS